MEDQPTTRSLLNAVKAGDLAIDDAIEKLRGTFYENLGHSRVDHDREERNGAPEVIYGLGKTADQILAIADKLLARGSNVLVTRVDRASAARMMEVFPDATHHLDARAVTVIRTPPSPVDGKVAVVSAGTSDFAVADEARVTLEFLGHNVEPINDAGVAGLHRLLGELPALRAANVIIAVAGMEGALPSVIAGQVVAPVIAVPTSVGYGANFGGITALLAMINSCASGVSVVNIDNGFGAACCAHAILRSAPRHPG